VKLIVDEMYTPAIAEQLRAKGHEALAVREVATLAGASDEALLRWAQIAGRAIITENVRDFLALHAISLQSGERHSGIILASNARFPRAKASTAGALVIKLDALLMATPHLDTDVVWL
jgi:predicted nuclease of predicted toxin-antitoxin system